MVIQLVTKQGKALYLRVPTAEGLVQRGADGSVREDAYVVKRVSRDSALALYSKVETAWSPKVEFLAREMCQGDVRELPVVDAFGPLHALNIVNDAHVVGALLSLDFDQIPVLIREDLIQYLP